MEQRFTTSTRVALAFLTAIFAVQVYWAATRPIGGGEAYLYDRFVRPTTRQVLASELPDRDVLYSLLEKRSVGLFHVSPFSVRLPSLLFGMLYLWSIWRAAKVRPWMLALALIMLRWDWFAVADGRGTALALCASAVGLAIARKHLNLIGICFGLSIAANTSFTIAAMILALAILARQRRWIEWTNDVLIPGAVAAVIVLAIPLAHAHATAPATPELTAGQAVQLRAALDALDTSARGDHVRIFGIPAVEPVINFYRSQHRATNWERAQSDLTAEHFDYYLLSATGAGWAEERHLTVLYRDADFLLAHHQPAAM